MAERRHKRKKVAPGPAMAVGSPFPIELGEEKFWASQLTLNDFGQFENWVKGQRVAQILRGFEALGDKLTIDQEMLQSNMIRDITTASLSPVDLVNEMSSLSGAIYIIWLSLKHKHPGLVLEEMREKIQNSGAALDLVTRVSGLFNTDDDEGKKSPDPPVTNGQTGTK